MPGARRAQNLAIKTTPCVATRDLRASAETATTDQVAAATAVAIKLVTTLYKETDFACRTMLYKNARAT